MWPLLPTEIYGPGPLRGLCLQRDRPRRRLQRRRDATAGGTAGLGGVQCQRARQLLQAASRPVLSVGAADGPQPLSLIVWTSSSHLRASWRLVNTLKGRSPSSVSVASSLTSSPRLLSTTT